MVDMELDESIEKIRITHERACPMCHYSLGKYDPSDFCSVAVLFKGYDELLSLVNKQNTLNETLLNDLHRCKETLSLREQNLD